MKSSSPYLTDLEISICRHHLPKEAIDESELLLVLCSLRARSHIDKEGRKEASTCTI